MKKLLVFIFAMFCTATHAAQIVNVEYIHKYINQKHGIEIPYSPELQSPKQAANMKYLLTLVDIANKKLNGFELTNYGSDDVYATKQAVDTVATITAVDTLIKHGDEYPFHFTPAATSNTYQFWILAAGTFYIDWGDGNIERVVRNKPWGVGVMSHTYATAANNYTIGLGGRATEYATNEYTGEIMFTNNNSLSSIEGCLGCVFPTLPDGTQPRFSGTFQYNRKLTGPIPEKLFAGIHGAPIKNMFYSTFDGCNGLTGSIPEKLFAGIQGKPAEGMFNSTFRGCSGLTGEIPGNLFAGISGAPAGNMFYSTFNDCSGLTGSIPEKLFAGIKGAPASNMFLSTFNGCSGLTGEIPGNLFAGISGTPASSMFQSTFANTGITSIPENLFSGIKGAPAGNMFTLTFANTGITSIPENLFSGVSGAPAGNMFSNTFSNTGITSIPENLFSGIKGAPAEAAFSHTFYGTSITSIPNNLFAGITGAGKQMYYGTFAGTNITSVPSVLFPDVPAGTVPGDNAFSEMFMDCYSLTGYAPASLFKNFAYSDELIMDVVFGACSDTGNETCEQYCYWQDNWEQVCEPQPDYCYDENHGQEICEPQPDYCYWQEDWQEVCDEPDADGNQNCHTEDMGSEICEPQPDYCYWQDNWEQVCEPQPDYCYDENHGGEVCDPAPDRCYLNNYRDMCEPINMATSCPVGTRRVTPDEQIWALLWGNGSVAVCEPE